MKSARFSLKNIKTRRHDEHDQPVKPAVPGFDIFADRHSTDFKDVKK